MPSTPNGPPTWRSASCRPTPTWRTPSCSSHRTCPARSLGRASTSTAARRCGDVQKRPAEVPLLYISGQKGIVYISGQGRQMKLALQLGYWGAQPPADAVAKAQAAERLG